MGEVCYGTAKYVAMTTSATAHVSFVAKVSVAKRANSYNAISTPLLQQQPWLNDSLYSPVIQIGALSKN
jgi:hypothetical protein